MIRYLGIHDMNPLENILLESPPCKLGRFFLLDNYGKEVGDIYDHQ